MHDEWFANEEKVRTAVGLLEKPVVEFPNAKEVRDLILLEKMSRQNRKLYDWCAPIVPCLLKCTICTHWSFFRY